MQLEKTQYGLNLQSISQTSTYLLLFLAQEAELQVDVVELSDEFSTGPFDHHCPALQPDLH